MALFLRARCLKNVTQTKNINALVKFSSSIPTEPGAQDPFKSGFTTVFKFPHVRIASLINRCKFFQTVSTALVLPGSITLSALDIIGPQAAISAVATGVCLSAFLYIVGNLSNKLIGIVYINEKEDFVRFAYLDYWGRRKDLNVPLEEIMPLNENSSSWMDVLYLKVNCMSPVPQIYKINFKFGGIVDRPNFKKIFMVD